MGRGGGGGYPREIDSASFSLGGDFVIQVLPWGQEFDMATTCFGHIHTYVLGIYIGVGI